EPGRLDPRVGATPWHPSDARPTGAARDSPGQDHAIAGPYAVHAVTDLFHDAGAFVTEQHRERHAPVAVVARPEVAVADAAPHDPALNLAGLRIVEQDGFDDDRSAGLVDDRSDRFAR